MFFDGSHGIDSRVMSTFDLHVSDSTPTNYDQTGLKDHQVKVISTVSVRLLDSNEAWIMLFYEKLTNADVAISSHLLGGLLYGDPLIHPTAAQHAEPLLKPAHCVHHFAASDSKPDIDSNPPASLLSGPVVAPAETPLSPSLSTRCVTCCQCISLAVDPPPPPIVDPAVQVSILDDRV
jgi:hypothetical protein